MYVLWMSLCTVAVTTCQTWATVEGIPTIRQARHATSCHAMSCHVTSRHVTSCDVMSCHVTSSRVLICLVASCLIVPCVVAISFMKDPIRRSSPEPTSTPFSQQNRKEMKCRIFCKTWTVPFCACLVLYGFPSTSNRSVNCVLVLSDTCSRAMSCSSTTCFSAATPSTPSSPLCFWNERQK